MAYRETAVIVSHDRHFLDNVALSHYATVDFRTRKLLVSNSTLGVPNRMVGETLRPDRNI